MKISIQTSLYIEKCIYSFVNIWKYERSEERRVGKEERDKR